MKSARSWGCDPNLPGVISNWSVSLRVRNDVTLKRFVSIGNNSLMADINDLDARDSETGQIIAGLINALPDPVLIVDGGTRVVGFNGPAREVFVGIRDGGALAFAIRTPAVLEAVQIVLSGAGQQKAVWHERTPVERLFEVFVSPFLLRGQTHAVLELRDVTEARRVERMRVNFIANVSHELRTPLTSLLGFVETLQGPARDDVASREKFLAIMGEQARRMARLVDDLLALSRIELNEHVRPQTSVDLVSVVRHIADTLEPVARDAGVTIKIDVPAQAMISGDRDELTRLAENLVENAIKYGGDSNRPSTVEVSISQTNTELIFTVRDNGPGIAPEHLPRLTERFYRVDTPLSRARGGTGLGLAIVKHIVARHRGRLEIESQLGQGTTFRVLLPIEVYKSF